MNNKLIVFEGIDGVGKSTLCRAVRDQLIHNNIPIVIYEEVEHKKEGFNRIKPFIKSSAPIESSLLFYLASAIYKSSKIKKLLERSWVICDRYVYSTLAYHASHGIDCSVVRLRDLPILQPDYVFLITVEETKRIERVKKRLGNAPNDYRPKRNNTFLGRYESELKKYHPIIIDNSAVTINSAVAEVLKHIKRSDAMLR